MAVVLRPRRRRVAAAGATPWLTDAAAARPGATDARACDRMRRAVRRQRRLLPWLTTILANGRAWGARRPEPDSARIPVADVVEPPQTPPGVGAGGDRRSVRRPHGRVPTTSSPCATMRHAAAPIAAALGVGRDRETRLRRGVKANSRPMLPRPSRSVRRSRYSPGVA